MRILHTVAPARYGGLEEVVVRLSAGLHARGHAVRVVPVLSGQSEAHPLAEALERRGVEVAPLNLPPRGYLREFREIRRMIREWRPDVLHTHGYRPDVLHRRPARHERVPIVSTLHGFTGGGWKNRLFERLQIRSVRRFDAVVAVSRAMVEPLVLQGVPPDHLKVIPNAWEEDETEGAEDPVEGAGARARLGVAPGRFHVGWVGRLSREKGADVLVEAFGQPDGIPGAVTVSLLGDGRERGRLQERAGELGLLAEDGEGTEFRFHGAVPGAGRLFPAFDAFVLSSRTEGTPMVLFEAMAAGVPIVATRVGGVPDVVGDEEAILVPPEDPQALREGILRLRRDPRGARERAERARLRLRRDFGSGPWLDRYEAVYREVASVHVHPVPGGEG